MNLIRIERRDKLILVAPGDGSLSAVRVLAIIPSKETGPKLWYLGGRLRTLGRWWFGGQMWQPRG